MCSFYITSFLEAINLSNKSEMLWFRKKHNFLISQIEADLSFIQNVSEGLMQL